MKFDKYSSSTQFILHAFLKIFFGTGIYITLGLLDRNKLHSHYS